MCINLCYLNNFEEEKSKYGKLNRLLLRKTYFCCKFLSL